MTEASLGLEKTFFYPPLIILPFLPVHYATASPWYCGPVAVSHPCAQSSGDPFYEYTHK